MWVRAALLRGAEAVEAALQDLVARALFTSRYSSSLITMVELLTPSGDDQRACEGREHLAACVSFQNSAAVSWHGWIGGGRRSSVWLCETILDGCFPDGSGLARVREAAAQRRTLRATMQASPAAGSYAASCQEAAEGVGTWHEVVFSAGGALVSLCGPAHPETTIPKQKVFNSLRYLCTLEGIDPVNFASVLVITETVITQLKEAEKRLEVMHEAQADSDKRAQRAFLASMSHGKPMSDVAALMGTKR